MQELEEGGQSQQVIPPLSLYESTQTRSVNLNELIKIHRFRQKYEIWDKFFNNSYICIENKVQPIEVYYQNDRFKSYLQDLSMIYFKDIEFNQNVRLQYIIRRLNFTLNGQDCNFIEFLTENKFYPQVNNIFTKEYLQELQNTSNDKKNINIRNSVFLAFLRHQMSCFNFTPQQLETINAKISDIYQEFKRKINSRNEDESSEDVLSLHRYQCPVNSITNQSEKSPEKCSEEENQANIMNYIKEHLENNKNQSEKHQPEQKLEDNINYFFDDLLYEEEIRLKIIQIQLEYYYLLNQISDPSTNQELKPYLTYLMGYNQEYIQKLTQLAELNNSNRHILKKIQRNISIQFKIGLKCIATSNSDDFSQCYGQRPRLQSVLDQKHYKAQRVKDIQAIQTIFYKIINKLQLKQIADTIEKVHQIQRFQDKNSKHHGKLLFSVTFEPGLGINEATIEEKDFLMLNELREESTLTSYLTPMKSYYSYISHNVFTFLNICEKQFPYDKEQNNNEQVLKKIKNKISRHKNLGKSDLKEFYHNNFKICHNCKILCQKTFLKQCKRRVKQEKYRQDQEEEGDDDSLYTEKNYKNRRHSGQCMMECQKNYCIYCIKHQFNDKMFNEKGWCPACVDNCHCNTCLREKMIQKLINMYHFVGGETHSIKTEKQLIEHMRISRSTDRNHEESASDSESLAMTELDEKVYEDAIKREILRNYSPREVEVALKQQEELICLLIDREQLKLENHQIEHSLFRSKIGLMNINFQLIEKQMQEQRQMVSRQKQRIIEELREEREQQRKRKRERRQSKSSERRKCRKLIRDEEIYYDFFKFDISDSSEQSSSFHIKRKKCKDYKYEPEYNF